MKKKFNKGLCNFRKCDAQVEEGRRNYLGQLNCRLTYRLMYMLTYVIANHVPIKDGLFAKESVRRNGSNTNELT